MATKRQTVGYNVYYAPDGCDSSFVGFAETIEDARAMAGQGGLEKSLWDTARAAGHCAGMTAPEGEEAEEPDEWFGEDGYYCAVRVLQG